MAQKIEIIKQDNTKIMILILVIAFLSLFIMIQMADFLKINLTTYYNIIQGLK